MEATPKTLSELTDQELLAEAKKLKTAAIINAVFIGFLVGILLFSVLSNAYGLVTLLPLFLAYKLMKNSKYNTKEVDVLLKERGLR
ncbi:FUSC family protein [Rufibacter immobilis]|uniref:FUSC family protein n=1 Tax=Rufibacter immobilis TaxID=1348778 RepID=A0A3M9MYT2_9BACT|nr:FUSC family protein [Rufibacter immobilis]RNI30297.1 FUSC family protein [Rufibacter immobilis]